jgi:DNA-binding beta-propeller fold protein YncE
MNIACKAALFSAMAAITLLTACGALEQGKTGATGRAAGSTPKFAVDPYWPKPLPGSWILGQVSGIAVGRDDTIWVVHRPGTLVEDEKGAQLNPPATKCCMAAPPVLQFDREGNLLRSWGGPGAGYDWPKSEHGIFVDADGNVWIGANDPTDAHILKFTPDGKFLMQIGKAGSTGGSNSANQLGRPAHMNIDAKTNELYVADGYLNRRVIVFNAATGNYKRHWGAYGNTPNDDKQAAYDPKAKLSPQFGSPVHCVRLSHDDLVYVCDRVNDRVQIFKKDGSFVKEYRVSPQTLQNGSVWDLVLSEDAQQKYIFIADGANNEIVTLLRATGEVVTSWGRAGRMAGQFKWVHNLAIDAQGNLYTAEVGYGRRAQKFKRVE